MIKYLILFLFTILLSAAAHAQTGTISGEISYGNDTALHGASVRVSRLNRTVRSNEFGRYQITDIPVGRYSVTVHLDGFADLTKIVDVVAGEEITLNFKLEIRSIRNEVTVTGSGTEETIIESLQTVDSVISTRIVEKASTSLGEVLESETGVAKRSFGPGASRPVIRGFDGDRVKVLQDGVGSGSVGSQSGDHGETVNPLSAERIEIVKGPATLLYGSSAVGGVINVISSDQDSSHTGFRGNLTTLGGTAERQGAISGGLEYGYRNWLIRGDASAQRTGDYQTPVGRVPNSSSRVNTSSFSIGYYGKHAFANGSYGIDLRRYGVPFAALFESGGNTANTGFLPMTDEEIDVRQRRHSFNLKGGFREISDSFLSDIKYNINYTDYRHKEIETADGIDSVGTVFENKTFSYRSMFEQAKYKNLTGRFGFEGFRRDYEVNGAEQLITGKVNHDSVSFFGLEEISFDRIKFQFGGRIENNRYDPVNNQLAARSFTGFSGGFGANVKLWSGGAFVANYTNSYRAPALEELYNVGPHIGTVTFEIGDENLKNERTNGIDLSLRHLSDKLRFTGGIFYYRIKDLVFLAPQDENNDGEVDFEDGLPVARYSQADADYLGVEFDLNVTINRVVGAFFSADAVRAKLIDSGINLIRIPPARMKFGVDFGFNSFNIRPEVIVAARQDRVFTLETPTEGYGILNVTGSYVIGTQHYAHVFTVSAYNLTDELYRNHVSFIKDFAPEIGRGIRAAYTIRFF